MYMDPCMSSNEGSNLIIKLESGRRANHCYRWIRNSSQQYGIPFARDSAGLLGKGLCARSVGTPVDFTSLH